MLLLATVWVLYLIPLPVDNGLAVMVQIGLASALYALVILSGLGIGFGRVVLVGPRQALSRLRDCAQRLDPVRLHHYLARRLQGLDALEDLVRVRTGRLVNDAPVN